jgi:drug/metabolite transporter (DMT)-like permease
MSGLTALGLLAILLWGSSIAFGRIVIEAFGVVTGPALVYLVGGAGSLVALALRPAERRKLARVSRRYWLVCGGLYVSYALAMNFGVGLATSRQQVLEVGILNYTWPALTLLFAVPIHGLRPRLWLVPGLVMAFAGVALALLARPGTGVSGLSVAGTLAGIRHNPLPYVAGLYCGVSWALYSNLTRKLAAGTDANPVPCLVAAVALIYLALLPFAGGTPVWSGRAVGALLYLAVAVNLLAYVFWDLAMRRGEHTLVAAASFLTPLLSTAMISLVLRVAPGWLFWLACVLVIAGAAIAATAARPAARDQ